MITRDSRPRASRLAIAQEALSLLTQTLVIHVIRTNKIPLLQSRSSWQVLAMTLVVMAAGIAIPFSPLGPGHAGNVRRSLPARGDNQRTVRLQVAFHLGDLGAFEGGVRNQAVLAKHKAQDGLLQGLAIVIAASACRDQGDGVSIL